MEPVNSQWLLFQGYEDDDCDSSSFEEDPNEFESKEFQKMSSILLKNETDYLSNCIKNEFNSIDTAIQTVKIKKRWTKEEVKRLIKFNQPLNKIFNNFFFN